jgi:penicillin-binding protein 1A
LPKGHSGEKELPLEIANPRKARPRILRLAIWVATCLIFWTITGIGGIWFLYVLVKDNIPELPELDQYNPALTTRVYDQSGILIGEFAVERRDVVPAHKIPRQLVEAFIASEDDNFFGHGGIDPMGILRAAIKNIRAGRIVQGGSTITQQVAKSFIGREKTFTRKFKEAVLARRLEEKFTKEEILYLYLNQIYLGHGSYGVQAAARNYFHKNVWDLNLNEMATIAGLPQAPSDYDPVDQPQAALERRAYVLSRMRDVGFIDENEELAAGKSELVAHPIPDIFRYRAPYFTEEVRRRLQNRYATSGVYEAGLTVETTLDLDWQHAAQLAMNQGLRMLDHRQGYRGALYHFDNKEKISDFLEKLQTYLDKQGDQGGLNNGNAVPAVVEEVKQNYAWVAAGHTRGMLPVFGLRWARKPNPTVHYQSSSARVKDVRKVLKPGDLILVRRADPVKLLAGEPPSMKKILPAKVDGQPETVIFALEQIPSVQGALASVEPRLGYLKAMIGGYNFTDSEFNRVLQACRQPGSSFKPIHYSLAIEEHEYNPATIIIDSAIVYDDPENQNRWKPENYEHDFKGKLTVHTALVNSMNVPSIKVLDVVGIKENIAWAHRLGITSPLREELGLALGASCVKPWDMLNVYSVFNMGGRRPKLNVIRKVTDRFGRVLINNTSYKDPWQAWDEKFDRAYDRLVNPMERLLSSQSNYILTHLLKGVATRGTGARSKRLGKPVAGKTGTTNDSADAWFMGFTHDVVTGVWVGNDEPKDPLGRGENGSRAALPIWLQFMQKVLAERPQAEFDVPPGIAFARIDPLTGLLARPDTPQSVLEAFKRGEQPKEYVPAKDVVNPNQFFKVDKNF